MKKGKKSKGKKGGKGRGGKLTWGEEVAPQAETAGEQRKRWRETQEVQDRAQRMQLSRAKRSRTSELSRRLAEPISVPLPAAGPVLKAKSRRRQRPKRPKREEARKRSGLDDGAPILEGAEAYERLLLSMGVEEGNLDADMDESQEDSRSGDGDSEAEEEEELDELDGASGGGNGFAGDAEDAAESDAECADDGDLDALDDFGAEAEGDEGSDSDSDLEGEQSDAEAANNYCCDPYRKRFALTPMLPDGEAEKRLSAASRPVFSSDARIIAMGTAGTSKAAQSLVFESCGEAAVPLPLADGVLTLVRDCGVQPMLAQSFVAANVAHGLEEDEEEDDTAAEGVSASQSSGDLEPVQALVLPAMLNYCDVLYSAWQQAQDAALHRACALHILNHVLKARARKSRHNRRLRRESAPANGGRDTFDLSVLAPAEQANAVGGASTEKPRLKVNAEGNQRKGKEEAAEAAPPALPICLDLSAAAGPGEERNWMRDQGFVRPTVVVLLPIRSVAYDFVESLLAVLGARASVSEWDRFADKFGPSPESEDDVGDAEEGQEAGGKAAAARKRRAAAVLAQKPGDHKALFGGGRNSDDDFKLGIALTPGAGKGKGAGKGIGVKLFSNFYASDIILASPLGLHLTMGPKVSPDYDADFLSSIEICLLSRADVLLQQNWTHILDAVAALNCEPRHRDRTDFSRVRKAVIKGQGSLFRQTIVTSAFADPAINALFSRSARSISGGVRVTAAVPAELAAVSGVAARVRQLFRRVPCTSVAEQADARFAFFKDRVLPSLLDGKQQRTVVFVPSYFDFLRVRNCLKAANAAACYVHEHAKPPEVTRARADFFHGRCDTLVYTGRAHFFNRHRLRGARHWVLYAPPDYPHFYPELVNMLEEPDNGSGDGGEDFEAVRAGAGTCLTLFTRFDVLALARVVGDDRAAHMVKSAAETFLME